MNDALTAEALRQIEAAIEGAGPLTAAHLRQVLAVAAGRLASLEGSTHVQVVLSHLADATRGVERQRLGIRR